MLSYRGLSHLTNRSCSSSPMNQGAGSTHTTIPWPQMRGPSYIRSVSSGLTSRHSGTRSRRRGTNNRASCLPRVDVHTREPQHRRSRLLSVGPARKSPVRPIPKAVLRGAATEECGLPPTISCCHQLQVDPDRQSVDGLPGRRTGGHRRRTHKPPAGGRLWSCRPSIGLTSHD